LPVLATQYAGLTAAEAGSIYLASTAVILTGPVFGWLSDHVSRTLVLRIRSTANAASSLILLFAPNLTGFAVGAAVDGLGKAAFRPAWGSLMAHVAGLDRRRRAYTMGLISMGEDGGEIVGPIAAGFLWNAYGAAAMLGTRAVVAVVAEVYTIAMERSLKRLDDQPRAGPLEAMPPTAGVGAAIRADRA
ncbi:MAG TPA: MFS transporter, partial [Gaiellaceae bacterium]|nr:MFS transporter [Gaiellaceae bacterium]